MITGGRGRYCLVMLVEGCLVTARIQRMRKALFSQVSCLSTGEGVTHLVVPGHLTASGPMIFLEVYWSRIPGYFLSMTLEQWIGVGLDHHA